MVAAAAAVSVAAASAAAAAAATHSVMAPDPVALPGAPSFPAFVASTPVWGTPSCVPFVRVLVVRVALFCAGGLLFDRRPFVLAVAGGGLFQWMRERTYRALVSHFVVVGRRFVFRRCSSGPGPVLSKGRGLLLELARAGSRRPDATLAANLAVACCVLPSLHVGQDAG